MAEKLRPAMRSMNDIVDFMLESDDEIDLGEHSSDESNVDSDWEYEEEDFQPQKPVDSPPLACDSDESNVTMDDICSQTNDVPSVSTPISTSNSTDILMENADNTNTCESTCNESLEEASSESDVDVSKDNGKKVIFLIISLSFFFAQTTSGFSK